MSESTDIEMIAPFADAVGLTLTVTDASIYSSPEGSLGWALTQAVSYEGSDRVEIMIDLPESKTNLGSRGVVQITGPISIINCSETTVDISYNEYAVMDGGSLLLEGVNLDSGELYVDPTARLEGSFRIDGYPPKIYLFNWSGSTAQLRDNVLGGADWSSTKPLEVVITEFFVSYDEEYGALSGDVTLANLGEGFGSYTLTSGFMRLYIENGCHVLVEEGVSVKFGNETFVAYDSQLTFTGGNVVSSTYVGWKLILSGGGEAPIVVAHDTRFEVTVQLGKGSGLISGEGITFAATMPLVINASEWDGTGASLSAALSAAMSGCSYTIEVENPILGLNGVVFDRDVVINSETLAQMLPQGFAGLAFDELSVGSGHTLTVQDGMRLVVDTLSVDAEASVVMEAGSGLANVFKGSTPSIYLNGGGYDYDAEREIGGGQVTATGADLKGVRIESTNGILNLSDCYLGRAELNLMWGLSDTAAQPSRITGCDLSRVTTFSVSLNYGEDGRLVTPMLDLSGNYWGTTDLDEIKAKIDGYDEAYIILGDILEAAPEIEGIPYPELILSEPEIVATDYGTLEMTVSWNLGDEDTEYELYVDGEYYTNAYGDSSMTVEFAQDSGEHSYYVVAITRDGYHAIAHGEPIDTGVLPDTPQPELTLYTPMIEESPYGGADVTLSWDCPEGVYFDVYVDDELWEADVEVSGCSFWVDHGEHSYYIVAKNADYEQLATARGENFVVAGDLDTPGPELTLHTPEIVASPDGGVNVTLSWDCLEGVSFDVYVNDQLWEADVEGSSYTFWTEHGEHSYYVVAWDAAGNSSTTYGDNFVVAEPSGPELTLHTPAIEADPNGGANVTLSWDCPEGVSFDVYVDDQLWAENVEGSSYTFWTEHGEHSYYVVAWDDAGYSSTTYGENFVIEASPDNPPDTLAPEISLDAPQVEILADGQSRVTFRWTSSEEAGYELTVGESTYRDITGNSFSVELPDGEYSYSLKATDAAGNSSETPAESLTLDATAPVLESETPQVETISNGLARVTFSWSSSEVADYELTVNGVTYRDITGNSFSLELPNGEYRYSLKATDAAGNSVETPEQSVTVEAVAPEVTVSKLMLTPVKGGHEEKLTLNWRADTRVVAYSLSLGKLGEAEEDIALPKANSTSYSGTFEDGVYTYTITAEDAKGNVGRTSGSFVVDTTAPEFSLSEPHLVKQEGDLVAVTLNWSSAEELATCTLTIDGRKVRLDEAAENGTYSRRFNEETGRYDYSYMTTLDDGRHEYRVTGADADGNSATQTGSFYLDATAPAAPKLSKPKVEKTGEGLLTVTLSWKGESGSDYLVDVRDAEGNTVATHEGNDPRCVLTLPDGAYTYTVTARDAAGNLSKPSSAGKYSGFSLDATSPAVESTSLHTPEIAPAKKGKASVTFSWDEVEEGATYTLMVDGKRAWRGKGTLTTLKLADGEHRYSLIVTDKAGNSSEVEGSPISIDAVAPVVALAAPRISYAEGGVALVELSWKCSEAASYVLTLDGEEGRYTILSQDGGESYRAYTADGEETAGLEPVVTVEGLNVTCTLKLTDGSYRYSLTATDKAVDVQGAPIGNSTTTKAASLLVDSSRDAATGAVSLKAVKPTKSADGRIRVTLGWTAPKDARGKALKGLTYTLRVDGVIVYTGSSTSRTLVLDDLADGGCMHSYSVTATDKYGNSVTVDGEAFGLDTAAPVLTDISAGAVQDEEDAKGRSEVTLRWKGEEAASYIIKVGNKTYTNPELTRDGEWYSFTASDLFGDMTCKYSITVADGTDRKANKLTYSGRVLIDTKGPKVTLRKPVLAEAEGGLVKATLGWKSEKGASYELTVDGTTYSFRTEDGGASYSITTADGEPATGISYSLSKDGKTLSCTLLLADGQHSYSVSAWDAVGNPSAAPAVGSFSYDTTPPDIILGVPLVLDDELTAKGLVKAELSWLGEAGVSYTVMVDGKSYNRGKATTHSINLAQGDHSYVIIARDKAGNNAVYSTTLTVSLVDGKPELNWHAEGMEDAVDPAVASGAAEGCCYSFELAAAHTVSLQLAGLAEDATLRLQREGGQGSIELSAHAATTLDRELNLSAGTYYLNVEGASGVLAGASLNLELVDEKNTPLQLTTLA